MTKVSLEDLDEITRDMLKHRPEYIQKRYIAIADEFNYTPYEIHQKRIMAIMKNVEFGCTDRGVMLTFTAYDSEVSASNPYLLPEDAIEFIKEYGVKDVHDLESKPVWMLKHGNMMIWVEPCVVK